MLTPAVQQSGTWDGPDGAAIRAALAPGMTVVDVGAHVGYFALLAAQCVGPGGKVVAVEPAPENYALLAANVARVGATQIEAVHGAAWREAGELELRLSPTNTGDHRVYDDGADRARTRVPAVRLDEVLADCERLDLVIVDTQGAEQPVLEGMSEALTRWRPRLQVEFWPDGIREFGDDPEATLAFYRGLRYDIRVLGEPDAIDGGDDLARLVAVAESRPGGFCTLLLTPRRG